MVVAGGWLGWVAWLLRLFEAGEFVVRCGFPALFPCLLYKDLCGQFSSFPFSRLCLVWTKLDGLV